MTVDPPKLDPYYLLGVPASATPAEIRAAYRRRAAELHPDRQPPDRRAWASEEMKQLNAARDLLLNPARRQAYDERQRVELNKELWRARRDTYTPPPAQAAAQRRRWRRQGLWLLYVLGMCMLLSLCVYSMPLAWQLATVPDASMLEDPRFWLDLGVRLFLALARAVSGPALLAVLLGLVFANLSRLVRR